jgi:hypothetical protein
MQQACKMKRLGIVILILSAAVSCSTPKAAVDIKNAGNGVESFVGQYFVTENYSIKAGALTGQKGESKYTITISKGIKENEIVIENFANSYKANAYIKGDSLFIPSQKFPYHESRVTIMGQGKKLSDTIYYDYFSGGPAGQIECKCIAVRKK